MEPGKRGPGHRACRQACTHADWLGTEHPWGSVADGPAVGWAHIDKWGVELRSAYRTQAPGRAPPPCAPTGPTSSRGRPARRVSGVRACPRCARPPRASAACPWAAPLVLSRATRKRSSASTPPDSTSETLRPRHGAAQAPRYEGCRVLRDPHRDGGLEGEHAPSDLASSHIAWNRWRGRTSECRVAVPVVTKRWWEHLSHSHPSGHLTPVSRLSRPHRPDTWSAGRGGCPSCPSPPDLPAPRVAHRAPRLDHSFSAPWHDMAEDVSPAIMKHVGEHFR